ncbi:uncharacterized protein LOC105203649 isoform X2 [Solenopsis invicta]|uniref:uncharacterized protein LOC105203649 isoform X2 n=1 Tax=Solenopsis invicta TaxID=13686 RepID=UPI00193E42A8|nr:uncharacterized protein LOC105203649 isoform X2 [Solenopsis invicta]
MSRKLFDICRVMSRNSFDIATVIFLTSFTRRPSLADDKHSSDHSLLTDDGRRPSIIVDAGLLIMVTETRQLHTPDSSLYERLRPRRTSKKRKNLSSETWAVENFVCVRWSLFCHRWTIGIERNDSDVESVGETQPILRGVTS